MSSTLSAESGAELRQALIDAGALRPPGAPKLTPTRPRERVLRIDGVGARVAAERIASKRATGPEDHELVTLLDSHERLRFGRGRRLDW